MKQNYTQRVSFTNLYCIDNFVNGPTGPQYFGLSICSGFDRDQRIFFESSCGFTFEYLTRQKAYRSFMGKEKSGTKETKKLLEEIISSIIKAKEKTNHFF